MGSLKNKIGLVTGGGRGIGKAIALALAKEGVDVAIVYNTDLASAEATAAEIRALGQRSMIIRCDVAVWEDAKETVDRVVREWGGIDVLVNNAGTSPLGMVEDIEKSEWDYVMSVDLDGTYNCSRAVIGPMKQRGGGNIVNISSMAGKRISFMSGAHYAAAKAGVLAFTRQLAFELAHFNIRVNALCPGAVITPTMEHKWPRELMEKVGSQIPLGRLGLPEDIADVVTFLVSDKARWITGAAIDVDGGQNLGRMDWETYVRARKRR